MNVVEDGSLRTATSNDLPIASVPDDRCVWGIGWIIIIIIIIIIWI
jgi:hypothetical protein